MAAHFTTNRKGNAMNQWEDEYELNEVNAVTIRNAQANTVDYRLPIAAAVLFIVLAVVSLFLFHIVSCIGYLVVGIGLIRRSRGAVRAGSVVLIVSALLSLALLAYEVATASAEQLASTAITVTDVMGALEILCNIACYMTFFHLFGKGFSKGRKGGLWLGPMILSIIGTVINCIWVSLMLITMFFSVLDSLSAEIGGAGPFVMGFVSFVVIAVLLTLGVLEAIALYQASNWAVDKNTISND